MYMPWRCRQAVSASVSRRENCIFQCVNEQKFVPTISLIFSSASWWFHSQTLKQAGITSIFRGKCNTWPRANEVLAGNEVVLHLWLVSHIIFAFNFVFWLPTVTAEAAKPDDITILWVGLIVCQCVLCAKWLMTKLYGFTEDMPRDNYKHVIQNIQISLRS